MFRDEACPLKAVDNGVNYGALNGQATNRNTMLHFYNYLKVQREWLGYRFRVTRKGQAMNVK
jgi:hypothetical protein